MLKKIILAYIISIPLILGTSQAQQTRMYEEKGEQLLKAASDKLKSFNTIKIAFSYGMENSQQGILETMEGTLYSKGDQFRMKVGDNMFISDGNNVWIYMEDIDEVQLNTVDNSDINITPTAILDEFDKQYRSTFIRQEQDKGKLIDIVDLVPNQAQAFFKYRIGLDARTNMMVYAIAYDRHGGTYTYTMKQIEPDVTIPAGTFTFSESEFPGVDIIDLR